MMNSCDLAIKEIIVTIILTVTPLARGVERGPSHKEITRYLL